MYDQKARERNRRWYVGAREYQLAKRKKDKQLRPNVYQQRGRLSLVSVRRRVFIAYGNKCVCCGETQREFLSLDHVGNDGAKQRRELNKTGHKSTLSTYYWAIKNGFPPSLQLLCYNCNMSKGFRGYCPHQVERVKKNGYEQAVA